MPCLATQSTAFAGCWNMRTLSLPNIRFKTEKKLLMIPLPSLTLLYIFDWKHCHPPKQPNEWLIERVSEEQSRIRTFWVFLPTSQQLIKVSPLRSKLSSRTFICGSTAVELCLFSLLRIFRLHFLGCHDNCYCFGHMKKKGKFIE